MQGIILTGGSGTRLGHFTSKLGNKHLYPINDKFVIDFSLNTLKQIGITDLTVILGGNYFNQIVSYLKDGSEFGFNINYVYQSSPNGIAAAINLCKNYIKDDFVVVLGDNIFENKIDFTNTNGSSIVLHKHSELYRFGVASIKDNKIINIVEKPKILDDNYDNYAITGCYKFDLNYFEYFKSTKPSSRGEFEITDILNMYLNDGKLNYTFNTGFWSDAGTVDSVKLVSDYFYKK